MMKIRRLPSTVLFALSASLLAACGGTDAQPETAQSTPPPPAPTTPATPAPADTAAQTPAPAETAAKKEEPPAPKPLKERLVGVWQLSFDGEVKAAAEADAKKKAGKDEKKLTDLMKKAEETAGKDKIETTSDSLVWWDGDKTTSKAKYEIVKEDAATNTIVIKRVGKDEITKKDVQGAELSITFKDDNTIEFRDPKEKDPKKAKLLVYKKGPAGSATPATPATPASGGDKAGAKPATPAAPATPATPATPAAPAKK